jgi:hypothetical protein
LNQNKGPGNQILGGKPL